MTNTLDAYLEWEYDGRPPVPPSDPWFLIIAWAIAVTFICLCWGLA